MHWTCIFKWHGHICQYMKFGLSIYVIYIYIYNYITFAYGWSDSGHFSNLLIQVVHLIMFRPHLKYIQIYKKTLYVYKSIHASVLDITMVW